MEGWLCLYVVMAHVRKDTLAKVCEWAKHLRPWGKRVQARRERVAGRKLIKEEAV